MDERSRKSVLAGEVRHFFLRLPPTTHDSSGEKLDKPVPGFPAICVAVKVKGDPDKDEMLDVEYAVSVYNVKDAALGLVFTRHKAAQIARGRLKAPEERAKLNRPIQQPDHNETKLVHTVEIHKAQFPKGLKRRIVQDINAWSVAGTELDEAAHNYLSSEESE